MAQNPRHRGSAAAEDEPAAAHGRVEAEGLRERFQRLPRRKRAFQHIAVYEAIDGDLFGGREPEIGQKTSQQPIDRRALDAAVEPMARIVGGAVRPDAAEIRKGRERPGVIAPDEDVGGVDHPQTGFRMNRVAPRREA